VTEGDGTDATVYSVLCIPVRPGVEQEFVREFAGLEVLAHAARQPGFRGARLLRPLGAEARFVVIAARDPPESYDGWLQNPVRNHLRCVDRAVHSVVEARGVL
jgi:heme-degrading monooxygenase HmoA